MKRAVSSLQELQPGRWASVTWAGPGYGACLELVSRLASGSCMLLEPHPALHARLARRLAGTPVRVDARALAPTAGTREFHLMSDPVRSTLLDVGTVMRERPNLRCLDTIEVEVMALAELVGEQGIDPGQPNLLILDDTGMEEALLGATGPQAVQAFSHVLVGSSAGSGLPRAHPEGFGEPLRFESDIGQAWLVYARQRVGVILDSDARSRARIQELEAQIDSLGTERDELVHECRELGTAAAAHQARTLELEQALAAATQAREDQGAQDAHLREQLRLKINRIGEFETTVARQQQRIVELERAFATASQAHGQQVADKDREILELNTRLGEMGASIAQQARHLQHLDKEGARLMDELAGKAKRIGELEATVARQQQRLGELDQRLKDAEQSARLANRLQALREQDLRDLEERYGEARQVQEHQHALLVRISDRLGAAASHFHALADARGAAPEAVVFEEVGAGRARAKKGRRKGNR